MKHITKKYRSAGRRFFRFCPHCGTRFVLRTIHASKELVCPSCRFVFWQNSKPTASACLVSGNSILLTKRGVEPYKHKWDVPGGFLEIGEDPVQGLRREIQEELGIALPRRLELLNVYIDEYTLQPPQVTLNFYFLARITKTKKIKPDDDIADAQWFPLQRLPTIAFANGRAAVRELKKLRNL